MRFRSWVTGTSLWPQLTTGIPMPGVLLREASAARLRFKSASRILEARFVSVSATQHQSLRFRAGLSRRDNHGLVLLSVKRMSIHTADHEFELGM
jgi:hypothetical protein